MAIDFKLSQSIPPFLEGELIIPGMDDDYARRSALARKQIFTCTGLPDVTWSIKTRRAKWLKAIGAARQGEKTLIVRTVQPRALEQIRSSLAALLGTIWRVDITARVADGKKKSLVQYNDAQVSSINESHVDLKHRFSTTIWKIPIRSIAQIRITGQSLYRRDPAEEPPYSC